MARFSSFVMVAMVAIVCFGFSNADAEIREVGSLDLGLMSRITGVATARQVGFVTSQNWGNGVSSGLWGIDISQPAEPRLMEYYEGAVYAVETQGDYAFVGCEGDEGLKVFFGDSLIYSGGPSNVSGLAVRDSLLYAVVFDSTFNTNAILETFSISNLSEPTLLGQLELTDGWGKVRFLVGSRLCVEMGIFDGTTEVVIVDVSDPRSPQIFSRSEYRNDISDVTTDGERFFITYDREHRQGLEVRTLGWELISAYGFPSAQALKFHGGYLYVASGGDTTVRVFDVSNPEELILVDQYNSGRWAKKLCFDGELLYLAEADVHQMTDSSRLLILDVSEAANVPFSAASKPTSLCLNPAYPNPFNSTTRISFSLPSAGSTSLNVFDIEGREVRQLISGSMPAGASNIVFDANGLPTGAYFLRLQGPNGEQRLQKVILGK